MKKTRNAGLIKRLAVFILMLTLLVSLPTLQVSAESMGMMTENIPDTDIKGATGGGGEIISAGVGGVILYRALKKTKMFH